MLVKIPRRWEVPEREAASETLYQSRRTVLKALGFVGLEALGLEARDLSGLYPAKRSPKYRLDRPITPQWAATGYNNFYERYCQMLWMGEVRRSFPEPSIHP